ncbi:hypothetical protein TruAng_005295 [Truncatella angustata]|nr:hypothetical protein TruAng_005295 [Truncatella angustata]
MATSPPHEMSPDLTDVISAVSNIQTKLLDAPKELCSIVSNFSLAIADLASVLDGVRLEKKEYQQLEKIQQSCYDDLKEIDLKIETSCRQIVRGQKAWKQLRKEPSDVRELGGHLKRNTNRVDKFWEKFRNGLLSQFTKAKNLSRSEVRDWFTQGVDTSTNLSAKNLSDALVTGIKTHTTTIIVIDGLDEIKVELRSQILDEIHRFLTIPGVQICATSRYAVDIEDSFSKSCTPFILEPDLMQEDISSFLKQNIPKRLPPELRRNKSLIQEIHDGLSQAAGGIFLTAQILLSPFSGWRAAKAAFPDEHSRLNEAYDLVMERIINLSDEDSDKDGILTVLSWLTFSRRPLSSDEINGTLCINLNPRVTELSPRHKISDRLDWYQYRSLAADLIRYDREYSPALVHFSAQEYLVRALPHVMTPSHPHVAIAETCIAFLSLSDLQSGPCSTPTAFKDRLRKFPLYDYAAQNWGHHARKSAMGASNTIDEFPQRGNLVAGSFQTFEPDSRVETLRMTKGVHLAALFGLPDALNELIDNNQGSDVKDGTGRTPLSLGAQGGYCKVVNVLIGRADVDVDSRDAEGRTPLSWAAEHGHCDVVRLMLKKQVGCVNTQDYLGRTPLHWAARSGYDRVVRLLIDDGKASLDIRDADGSTPLHDAIRKGRQAVQDMLIERGANLNIQDQNVGFRKAFDVNQSQQAKNARKYLTREHETLQRLNHPCVVAYLGYEEDPDTSTAAIYTEFCEGPDMRKIIESQFRKCAFTQEVDGSRSLSMGLISEQLAQPYSLTPSATNEADPSDGSTLDVYVTALIAPTPDQNSTIDTYATALTEPTSTEPWSPTQTTFSNQPWNMRHDERLEPEPLLPPLMEEIRIWSFVFQISAAVAYLHHGLSLDKEGNFSLERTWSRILHRDIKPANMTISELRIDTISELAGLAWTSKPNPESRPSSLTTLELAQNRLSQFSNLSPTLKVWTTSVHQFLGSSQDNYLLSTFKLVASQLDTNCDFNDQMTKNRRKNIIQRLRWLLEDGADTLFEEHTEDLHLAVILGKEEMVKTLLKLGTAVVNKIWRCSNWTPLHLAVQKGYQEIEDCLLHHSADAEAKDKYLRHPSAYKVSKG